MQPPPMVRSSILTSNATLGSNDHTLGDTTLTPKGTPVKGTPKKRAPAKAKAKTPEETEGGDLADTEKTPGAASPSAKKGGRKRKAAEITDTTSSPVKAEDDIGVNDNGETAATETPEKKKLVYNRKPKGDVNAAIAKLGKKQSKAEQQAMADTKAAVAAANAHHDATMANTEDPNISMFGGDAQMEEADEEGRTFDEEEQRMVNEQLSTLVKGGETAV